MGPREGEEGESKDGDECFKWVKNEETGETEKVYSFELHGFHTDHGRHGG